ncbi:MAG: TolC family protein [Bacteroidetes bacterium]|jgi:outer membrane protein TolC|nr:TolC family protein [Bacteroidota bacterium]
MKQIAGLLLCLWVGGFPLLAQDSQSFTLEQAIDYAIERNNQLDIDKLEIEDADAQILEYWARGIPKLNGSVQYQHFVDIPVSLVPAEFFGGMPGTFAEVQFGTNNRLEGALELSALLFDGGFFVGLKAQRLYKELRKKELLQSETQVRYNVTKAFLNVLVARENVSILEKNIANLEGNLKDAEANFEAGFIEKLDVDRIRLSLSSLETQRQSVEGNALIASNLLKFQMGYPINDSVEVVGDLDDIFSSAMVDKVKVGEPIDYEGRMEYQIANKGLELSQVDIDRLRAGYLPTLNGFASASRTLQRNDLFDDSEAGWLPATIVGVNMSFSLFDGFDRRAKIQRAKITREKTVKEINQLERSIQMEVRNARINYNNMQKQSVNAQMNLDLAEEIYQTTQIKFDEGVGSSVELRQAESDYYSAQSNQINAMYDLLDAYTELQKALGKI